MSFTLNFATACCKIRYDESCGEKLAFTRQNEFYYSIQKRQYRNR
jgi:hypothetical protein